jgi:hypothetical protein
MRGLWLRQNVHVHARSALSCGGFESRSRTCRFTAVTPTQITIHDRISRIGGPSVNKVRYKAAAPTDDHHGRQPRLDAPSPSGSSPTTDPRSVH